MSGASEKTQLPVVAPEKEHGTSIYFMPDLTGEFRQGEILSEIKQYIYNAETEEVDVTSHGFAIIASQDCDLLQDHNKLSDGGPSELNSILLFEATPTDQARQTVVGTDIWKRIVQNKDDRYHCLQAAPSSFDHRGVGIPDLVIDFKRFFAISPTDLRFQLNSGDPIRRCSCLETPYKEHFQSRAGYYLQRIAVPEPHRIASVAK